MTLKYGLENTLEIFVKEDTDGKLDYLKAYGECSYILEILYCVELDIPERQLQFYINFIEGLKARAYKWIHNNYKLIQK